MAKCLRLESPLLPTAATGLFVVLTHRTLLRRITQFQRGIPVVIRASENAFVALGLDYQTLDAMLEIGRYWSGFMRCGELADVQLLCRMREWPEFADDNDMCIANLPAFAMRCGRLDVIQWLHAENDVAPPPWFGLLLSIATSQKNWDVARWLMAHRPKACTEKITDAMVDAVGDVGT